MECIEGPTNTLLHCGVVFQIRQIFLSKKIFGLLLLAASVASCAAPTQNADHALAERPLGSLIPGRDMTTARTRHSATMTPDRKVLIAGGRQEHGVVLASTEVYDPTTETFSAAGKMTTPREGHVAVLLGDQKILIAGGATRGGVALASSEEFEFDPGQFVRRGNMHAPRVQAVAIVLRNGKVLITGGEDGTKPLDSAETYEVLVGKWTLTGKMSAARSNHTATMLSDGRVLLVGGCGSQHSVLASAEIYDPNTNQFTPAGMLHEARCGHTAALLANGRVLIAGGRNEHGRALSSAELYDPQVGSFTPTGSLAEARFDLPAFSALLSSGVLVVGGAASAEIYDWRRGVFHTASGKLDTARHRAAAIQLLDGTTRIFGGEDAQGASTAKTWIFR